MIIETSLASINEADASRRRRHLVRRTVIDSSAHSLHTVVQRLLEQWDLGSTNNESYSLLIALPGSRNGSREDHNTQLIVDKQDEWELFCREHRTGGHEIVRAELIQSSLLRPEGAGTPKPQVQQEESSRSLDAPSKPEDKAPTAAPKLREPQKITYAFQSTEERPAKAAGPQFGFQSIDPQPVKPRKGFSYEEIEKQKRERERLAAQEQGAATTSTYEDPTQAQTHPQEPSAEEGRPMSAYERVMARSRMQGEALNRAFGTLQARSAGKQYTPQDEGETSTQPNNTGEPGKDASPRQVAVSPKPEAQMDDRSESEAASAPAPAADVEQPTVINNEGVIQHNTRLGDAWQERLQQMGHGPGSGSPYAKLRFGKGKDRATDGNEADASSPANIGISQSASAIERLDQAGPSKTRMMSDNGEGSYGELGDLPSSHDLHEAAPDEQDAILPAASLASEEHIPSSSASSRIKASFSRRRLFSNRRKSTGYSLQTQSASASRPGTPHSMADVGSFQGLRSSPPSVIQRSPRERRLSLRSLTESILQTSSLRGSANRHDVHNRIEPSSSPATGTTTPDIGPPSRTSTHKRLSLQGRSLSDVSILPRSMRRRRSPLKEAAPLSDIAATMSGSEITHSAHAANGSENGAQKSMNANGLESDTAGPSAPGEARPSLLRAAYTMQTSQTAVDLSSAGGITLHISGQEDSGERLKHAREGSEGQAHHRPVRDLFDLMLPREIRLACFEALIQLHEEEAHTLDVQSKNSRPHVGRPAALRELIRLGRVSKTWQSLVLDGQLWSNLDTTAIPNISNDSLARIIRTAGPGVKRINFQNMRHLNNQTLRVMGTQTTAKQAGKARQAHGRDIRPQRGYSAPQLDTAFESIASQPQLALPTLTHLSLQGFQPDITSSALQRLLMRLPQLTHLNVANLSAVNHNTLLMLGAAVPDLQSLNVSRCHNILGLTSVVQFIEAAQGALFEKNRASHLCTASTGSFGKFGDIAAAYPLKLRELRVADTLGSHSTHLAIIAKALPYLEVLDLSHSPDLTDDAWEAFVQHPGPLQEASSSPSQSPGLSAQYESKLRQEGPYVSLSARQAGANVYSDEVYHRRLHSNLRHLSLRSCRRLSDRFAVYLAHSVPNLKVLELSNVGPNLRDTGLVKLLETTPLIERIDVEHCLELGPGFVRALTPPKDYVQSLGYDVPSDNEDDDAEEEAPVRGRRRRGRARRDVLERAAATEPTSRQNAAADTEPSSSARRARPASKTKTSVWRRPLPPGAHLTHLVMSSLHRVPAKDILSLVRHCPNLVHLEVDDTRVNDAILKVFVSQARTRNKHNAYISLVDCRNLAKEANAYVFDNGQARAREGHVGWPYAGFLYEGRDVDPREMENAAGGMPSGQSPLGVSSRSNLTLGRVTPAAESSRDAKGQSSNEYDDGLVVVKTFWAWQSVDERVRARRKAESKRSAALAKQGQLQLLLQSNAASGSRRASYAGLSANAGEDPNHAPSTFARLRRDSLGAALQFISRGSAGHTFEPDLGGSNTIGRAGGQAAGAATQVLQRDGRIARAAEEPAQQQAGLLGPGHEGDDARGCVII